MPDIGWKISHTLAAWGIRHKFEEALALMADVYKGETDLVWAPPYNIVEGKEHEVEDTVLFDDLSEEDRVHIWRICLRGFMVVDYQFGGQFRKMNPLTKRTQNDMRREYVKLICLKRQADDIVHMFSRSPHKVIVGKYDPIPIAKVDDRVTRNASSIGIFEEASVFGDQIYKRRYIISQYLVLDMIKRCQVVTVYDPMFCRKDLIAAFGADRATAPGYKEEQ